MLLASNALYTVELGDCDPPCLNGGSCDMLQQSCICPSMWTGTACQGKCGLVFFSVLLFTITFCCTTCFNCADLEATKITIMKDIIIGYPKHSLFCYKITLPKTKSLMEHFGLNNGMLLLLVTEDSFKIWSVIYMAFWPICFRYEHNSDMS